MPSVLEEDNLRKASGYKIKYHPFGASAELFGRREDEVLVVGPKGTGKSLGVLHKQHLVLSKYPGSRLFMARKTRTSMTNSCIMMFQKMVLKPPDGVKFHKQDQVFNYPNGSMYGIVGLDDVQRLNSTEWDGGYIQEATEATEDDWEVAGACIRHGVVPYQQLIGDANPDKPTHWLKVRCDKGLTVMLKSFHQDNPKFFNHHTNDWTPEGKAYMARLQRLSGVRYKRLYKGDWAAAEGVVYEEWDQNVHMMNRCDLPVDWVEWPHYWAIDFGYTHPFVWGDYMEGPDGVLYLNRQIYQTRMLVEDLARWIMDLNQGQPTPHVVVCDHDAEGRAVFERHTGLLTVPAFKSIQPGIQAVQNRLRLNWNGLKKPGLRIIRDSLVKIDESLQDAGKPYSTEGEFDGYVWDEKVNKLVNSRKDEIPVDQDNHGMDKLRYMVGFIDSLGDDPQETEGLMYYDDPIQISPY